MFIHLVYHVFSHLYENPKHFKLSVAVFNYGIYFMNHILSFCDSLYLLVCIFAKN